MNKFVKKTLVFCCAIFLGYVSFNCTDMDNLSSENPFFTQSNLPFQAPPFDKIKDSDYKPAIEAGMEQQLTEIKKIVNNSEEPSFENTLVEMEKSGQLLNRVMMVFNGVASANTDSVLQKIQEEEAPKLAAHRDAIYLNTRLFERVNEIYENREKLKLDNESEKLIEYYYKQFVHAGANLPDEDKDKLKKLNEEEATLSAQFSNKLLAGTKAGALIVNDKSELDGLSQSEITGAKEAAEARELAGKWLIPLQNTTQQPALSFLNNRSIREKFFKNSWNRTEKNDDNDTRSIIERLAKIRSEKAKLLGFANYAGWKLENQMAKTPGAVETFLKKLVPATLANEHKEAKEIQAFIKKSGEDFKLQPWDWNYYAGKLRKERLNIDESQIKPYFVLENVLQKGIFYAANKLYGITFKEVHNIPVYQKDVRVFEVYDKDGTKLALFYADYYKRDNKGGGAWMDNFVQQSGLLGTKPVIYNVTNFTKPAPGEPALLSFDDVTTMFHEFGHALHGIFADQQYPSLSGTNVARDFVEFPSQFNEHWATFPEVLKNYALNYKTGKPIPQELVDKIKKAATFNGGYDFTELLEAANLDMAWHTLPADMPLQKSDEFEKESLKKLNLSIPEVPPRYRSSYFSHIWGGGYAAGYYAYLWSEMLDDDAFYWFQHNGGLTSENGDRFRNMILSRGATEDYTKMFNDFTGHDPSIEPMLKDRGLK
ncbi:MAG TPA: peptidyl-dipeptidase Dcp [Ignavibacteriaceae bacterium]|nr:peptidyl-dipeptidase Dcp [Ignavibacteriaceae bacterium]